MTEAERIQREIDKCYAGVRDGSTHGEDIMWLMGWADWSIEQQIIQEQKEQQ